ncbi:MAG: tetratricopeptide repeat-containing protein [Acidobacteriia bacterium]|nr:tetratricopeptide repeat-containing protein [Terriglobia bacterium]
MRFDQDDLPYFVPFVLLDEATRSPSGKRQTMPMKGFWMERPGTTGMRESDGRLRRNVCIDALREFGGKPVDKAASEVATILGRRTAACVSRIRVDYYQRRPERAVRDIFFSQFLSWREWVFESSEERLEFILRSYGQEFGQNRLRRLSELMEKIRRDPEQKARNRRRLLEPGELQRARIDSNYFDPGIDWQFLATDLWTLGRLYARIGEMVEAETLLERALEIWKTHGHHLPHVQTEAIPALEHEITKLSEDPKTQTH